MAKLSAAARKSLPSSTFAGPDRSFPIPDKNHARAALALLHNAPASAQPKIRARAQAMLGNSGGDNEKNAVKAGSGKKGSGPAHASRGK